MHNKSTSKLTFDGDSILVTGASTGIGRATAGLLAARGARVFLVARRREVVETAAREIREAGGIAECLAADISDRDQLDAAIDAAEAAFGPLYGLFANAGSGGRFAAAGDYDDAEFDAVLRTNLTSPFWAVKRVLPGMMARGRGTLLFTGSLASARGMANNAAYVASKHGLLGLARAIAIEAAPANVRSNCLIPGFIETPMMAAIDPAALAGLARSIPQKRMGSAEEAGEVAAFLLSEAASHVTGQSWSVDGGVLGTLAVG
ncbi:SDR family NAD(P)-dependent oxidoreductase [Sphingomonas canadensis]|uniref:SDR family NAD(P)-dependent oxidoreductase n=1 Tax=Sphingomonas canadensis TaxID=1219257 RepID=A0ABW3H4G0_9SPHN|nr:SDR family NAD(P)-dependent oxidoreductase [Sphingomonas canadensis]MCW3835909.1 SDR family oxidoreductase [Sphingomonas canadensis]